ncbi:pyrroline-5-carboxylate reductase family protein [Bosea sp. LjRoot237]|uniref:pyrroline-5-carboxylate reductase family protein n=1 Tax=Bosea sp. LjRoot237 TaxID=3342292 RepID=UPI003ECD51BC
MARSFPESILLLGAGRMGAAMLHGWLRAGMNAASISVVDPSASRSIVELARVHRFDLHSPIETLNSVDVAVIAVKPQALDSTKPALAAAVSAETLVISIVAGQRLEDLAKRIRLASHGTISRLASRCRTASSRASMAACETNC